MFDHDIQRGHKISIHAPAKGATKRSPPRRKLQRISIHAPAKGATGKCHEVDGESDISIHAPAKGATGQPIKKKVRIVNFNPRSREGSDK